MVNCVECGAPLGREGEPCEACGAAKLHEPRNGTRHPRIEDPDGMVYDESPLLRGDSERDESRHEPHRAPAEPPFVREPLRDDPSVRTPAFATAPLLAEPSAEPASFITRGVALAIDLVVLSALDVVLFVLATSAVLLAEQLSGSRVSGASDLVRSSISAGSMTLFLGYFAVLNARSGQTLGKVAMRIHVRDESGARMSLAQSILRTCGYGLSALPLGAGFLLALGPERRALHDRIARTVVVRERSAA
jgi:uncharacterized RDD family membrane protein YckC